MNKEQMQREMDCLENEIICLLEMASEYDEDDAEYFGIMFEVNSVQSSIDELRAELES